MDYLLSEMHPVGKSKAKFFRLLGFDSNNADRLEQGLLHIAHTEMVTDTFTTQHGVKYVIDGTLDTPSNNEVRIRTVWIIEHEMTEPRFVTAYPV
jgi:hypothetical protein